MRKTVLLTLLAVAAVFSLATSKDPSEGKRKKSSGNPAAERLTADALAKAYDADPKKADGKYKGKRLAVSGIVQAQGSNATSGAFLTLKSSSTTSRIQCRFSKAQAKKLGVLKKGTEVTLKCVCRGKKKDVILEMCTAE